MNCLHDNVISETELTVKHSYHVRLSHVGVEGGKWSCWAIGQGYDELGIQISEFSFNEHDDIAANAAAKMLIYLIEINHYKK